MDRIFSAIKAKINAKIASEGERLILGARISNYPDYKNVVGRIAALKDTLDIVDETRKEYLTSDEDAAYDED